MFILLTKKKIITIICIIIVPLIMFILLILNNNRIKNVWSEDKGYIVIIIDDFGNNGYGTEEMLNCGVPLTAAVMPFMPYSEKEAILAYEKGLDVIMHVPMEPNYGKKEWLGARGITTNLSDTEIKNRIKDGLKDIKYAVGMNNHMGSKATQDNRVVKAILEVVKEYNMVFIDSKTSSRSVIKSEADSLGVISYSRDVFLDNIKSKDHIKKQIIKLSIIADKKGYAIGIGHVGVEGGVVTAEAIKEMYTILSEQGYKFITISELIKVYK